MLGRRRDPAAAAAVAPGRARLIDEFDPDGAAPPESDDCRDELLVVRRKDGTLAFRGKLHDPVDGEVFLGVIDDLAEPCGPDDDRNLERRRADARKDLTADARRAGGLADHPDTDTDPGPAPATGAERSRAGAADDHHGRPVAPAGDRARHPRLRGPRRPGHRAPLGLRRRHRPARPGLQVRAPRHRPTLPAVADAMRRALNFRDGGCAFPGCTRRPRRCHAHHVDHWGNHGPTALDNLTLLCRTTTR